MKHTSHTSLPSDLRKLLFLYQDGVILCLVTAALAQGGFFLDENNDQNIPHSKFISSDRSFSATEISTKIGGKIAYLEVALRCFCQQGWLERAWNEQHQQWRYRSTASFSKISLAELDTYRRVGMFLGDALPFERMLQHPELTKSDLNILGDFNI